MSQVRRHDLGIGSDVTATDDANTFKKSFQTIGRPPVTEKDINDEYMKSPPNNQPFEPSSDRKHPGIKEGAWELDVDAEPEEKLLGDQGLGKVTKEAALQEQTEEGSVHPFNPTE